MDKVVNYVMTQLFEMAEYVCSKCSLVQDEPVVQQDVTTKAPASPICFSSKENYVEGELFN